MDPPREPENRAARADPPAAADRRRGRRAADDGAGSRRAGAASAGPRIARVAGASSRSGRDDDRLDRGTNQTGGGRSDAAGCHRVDDGAVVADDRPVARSRPDRAGAVGPRQPAGVPGRVRQGLRPVSSRRHGLCGEGLVRPPPANALHRAPVPRVCRRVDAVLAAVHAGSGCRVPRRLDTARRALTAGGGSRTAIGSPPSIELTVAACASWPPRISATLPAITIADAISAAVSGSPATAAPSATAMSGFTDAWVPTRHGADTCISNA